LPTTHACSRAPGLARLGARHQAGLQRLDIDAVVQGLDTLGRPLRQAAAHVVTHRVRDTQQAQALAEQVGEQPPALALVVAKGMVHANHRQPVPSKAT
jgi:hypothetical protein